MNKYDNILKYFHVYLDADYCPQTTSYVDMDDIHDAILYNGVHLENTERHYIIKSKQNAIDKRRTRIRQLALLNKKPEQKPVDENFSLDNYGFTPIEIELCAERMAGIPAIKSGIPRRQYERILESVKDKLSRHNISTTKVGTKL